MSLIFIFLLIIEALKISCYCIEGEDHCTSCNPITKLCIKCDKDIYIPNENGGCKESKKCIPGKNYCHECNKEGDLCQKCDISYYPDKNGGCSYTNNCDLSYKGECLKCKYNFILNNNNKICISLNSEELKNCKTINNSSISCEECKEGYYLNSGDKKCTLYENCFKSTFGICTKCNNGYYLSKLEDKCIEQNRIFEHCSLTIDGKTCDICDINYYFDENKNCIRINYCLREGENNLCEKCLDGYYLSESKDSCTKEINCLYGDRDYGICKLCRENYYIDYIDNKCKLNNINNEFKNCQKANRKCYSCIGNYNLGKDKKCTTSRNCEESDDELCIECTENYYLGLDHKCTNVEHCIYSFVYECIECEENYYYNKVDGTCKLWDYNFTHCKYGYEGEFCVECKKGYYINQTNQLCYNNSEKNNFYKCAFTYQDICVRCADNYFLGKKDNKCSNIKGCSISMNGDRCIECEEDYCLDLKTGICVENYRVISDEKKYYFRCNQTNEEGTECEVCLDMYKLKNGLCVDEIHCIEEKNNICQKCQNDEEGTFCLNPIFGCVEIFFDNCLRCNDINDFDNCDQCFDGYELDENNFCVEKGGLSLK